MNDTLTFTKEKFKALLVRLFMDGCKGRHDLYKMIVACPDALACTLQTFLKLPKSAKSQITIKSCDLLAILKDAFQEGEASYPETRESVVQRLMESVPKPCSMERYEKEFQRMLFDKWVTLKYDITMSSTTNNDNIYHFDSLQESGLRAPVNTQMDQWIINF